MSCLEIWIEKGGYFRNMKNCNGYLEDDRWKWGLLEAPKSEANNIEQGFRV